MIFSSGKSVAAIVMAMQVDRGLISYTDEVSKHWPDFAKNGKSEITIADVLRYGLLHIFLVQMSFYRSNTLIVFLYQTYLDLNDPLTAIVKN